MWATDTLDVQVKSLDGNQYAQVLYNGTYFSEIYIMANKADAGQALKTVLMELGVTEGMTVYG